MALDLRIESLRIDIAGASGHEHRIHRIASRAAAIFGERLSERGSGPSEAQSADIDALEARPVGMDLNTTSDEQAARSIANAWLDALALKLNV
jgi:hypothetical protein